MGTRRRCRWGAGAGPWPGLVHCCFCDLYIAELLCWYTKVSCSLCTSSAPLLAPPLACITVFLAAALMQQDAAALAVYRSACAQPPHACPGRRCWEVTASAQRRSQQQRSTLRRSTDSSCQGLARGQGQQAAAQQVASSSSRARRRCMCCRCTRCCLSSSRPRCSRPPLRGTA